MKKVLGILPILLVVFLLSGCSTTNKQSFSLNSEAGIVTMHCSHKSDFVFELDDSWGKDSPHYILSSENLGFKAYMFIDSDAWIENFEGLRNKHVNEPKFKDGFNFNNYPAFTYTIDNNTDDELFLKIFLGEVPADDIYMDRIAYLRITLDNSYYDNPANLQELLKDGLFYDMLNTISFSVNNAN